MNERLKVKFTDETDIQYHCLKTDPLPPVFLTDGDKQTYRLENASRELLMNWAYRVDFDLDEQKCPFTPTAIRIAGLGPSSQQAAMVLNNLKARVKRTN